MVEQPRESDLAGEFRLLVDSVVDYAIFLLDPDGIVRSWNPGAHRLKGYRTDDVVGRHFSVFYTDADREDGLPARLLEEARANGRVEHSGWRVRQDGSRFWADVVITALHDDGVLRGFGKVTRDMTEIHLAERERDRALERERAAVERLEELGQWRRDFIRAVAHDLQSPVISLTGFADLLEEDPPAETRGRYVERIRANTRSLQLMIDHLRTYALLDGDRVDLRPEPVVFAAFVRELVADLQPVLAEHQVEVRVPDGIVLQADRQALERILRNLLGNAARHTPADGELTVSARQEQDALAIEVRDTGEGIAAELLPRVFDRFQRGPQGHTGLGLAIVKEYVELHGGTIEIDSEVDRGTTVRLRLPVAPPTPARPRSGSPRPRPMG